LIFRWNHIWILLVALVGFLGVPCFSDPAPKWLSGERLDFEIRYGFISAGNASLLTRAGSDSSRIEFLTLAQNNGIFETIYPVRDTVSTMVLRKGFAPEVFRKVIHEGGYNARSRIAFDWPKKKAHLTDSVFWDNGALRSHSDTTVEVNDGYHCIISAFYMVRTLALQPGKEWYFQAVSGKKKYKMRVVCYGRETITVPAGTFKCLVVEPMLDGDGLFQAKGKLVIWLSDDERRLPVLMKSKIAVGSIRAELQHWNQGAGYGNAP